MKTKLTLFIAVIAVALFGTGCASTETNSDPLKNGLVAYYPFNGNAKDESGNGHDGSINGAALTIDRHGKILSAYSFDGAGDNIEISESEDFKSSKLSVAVWVYAKSVAGGLRVVSKDGGKSERQWSLDISGNGTFTGWLGLEDRAGQVVLKGGRISDGWNHLSQIWDGAALVLYINGIPVSSIFAAGSLRACSQPLRIGGGADDGPKFYFNGSIDDVRIYNRALSAAEVKALYDLEKPKAK